MSDEDPGPGRIFLENIDIARVIHLGDLLVKAYFSPFNDALGRTKFSTNYQH